ncbi:surface lipoprotein assembly modifier, partial [Psychrobacter sp. Rd 27.2]|uniref:surface lipoprotein assembly modifier n=1 Tax=Psychrobacter sp. Rd 27.2 TaxID=1926479 RepID=UPI000967467A
WGAITRFEQNLLGGSQYNQNYIATLNYNRKISKKLQISGSFSHSQKRYEENDLAEYYDGHSNSTAWIVLYQPKPRWLVYAGSDAMRDSLADEAESSDRYGIRGGLVY